MNKFIWDNNVKAVEKIDGSLILLYWYSGVWNINTRGSFADGELAFTGKSWKEWVLEAIPNKSMINQLNTKFTYIMEFVSPYNKIVRHYSTPQLYLLSVMETATGEEMNDEDADDVSLSLGILRPQRFDLKVPEQIKDYLTKNAQDDPTFEGLVLIDRNRNRIKFKSDTYVSLHHLVDNGNLFNPSRLVPLVLNGERDEIVAYLPEIAPFFDKVEATLNEAFVELKVLWERTKNIESQKDFALSIVGLTQFSSILFTARKEKIDIKFVWDRSADILVKKLFKTID